MCPSAGVRPLVYYLYRFYEPNLQRWVSRDPIGEREDSNLYLFVKNNPILYLDPDGREAILPWILRKIGMRPINPINPQPIGGSPAWGPCIFLGEAEVVGPPNDPRSGGRVCMWSCGGFHRLPEVPEYINFNIFMPPDQSGPCAPPVPHNWPPNCFNLGVAPSMPELPIFE